MEGMRERGGDRDRERDKEGDREGNDSASVQKCARRAFAHPFGILVTGARRQKHKQDQLD